MSLIYIDVKSIFAQGGDAGKHAATCLHSFPAFTLKCQSPICMYILCIVYNTI